MAAMIPAALTIQTVPEAPAPTMMKAPEKTAMIPAAAGEERADSAFSILDFQAKVG